jgi:hypothetical protein
VHHSPDTFSAPRMLTDRTRLSRACSAVAKIVPASHARLSPLSTGGEPSSPTRGVTPTRRPMQFTSQRPKAATTPVLVRRRPRFDLERVPPCRFRIHTLRCFYERRFPDRFSDRELAPFTLSPSLHVQAPSMVPTHASFGLMLTACPPPRYRSDGRRAPR